MMVVFVCILLIGLFPHLMTSRFLVLRLAQIRRHDPRSSRLGELSERACFLNALCFLWRADRDVILVLCWHGLCFQVVDASLFPAVVVDDGVRFPRSIPAGQRMFLFQLPEG